MGETAKFRLLTRKELEGPFFRQLPVNVKLTLNEKESMIGIAFGKKLISVSTFDPDAKKGPLVSCIWSTSNSVLIDKFKKRFSVTPAVFIAEQAIRNGLRLFRYDTMEESGKRLCLRLEKEGLVFLSPEIKTEWQRVKIANKWVSLANSRKRILR